MKITKSKLIQIIKEELASMTEAPIAYTAGPSPEERYKGYESPEEVGLPPREKRQLDPVPLPPGAEEQVAKGKEAAAARNKRLKHKATLADQLDHVDRMLADMEQYWKSNYGQLNAERLAEFEATRERWEMKKTQLEVIMRKQGFRELTQPMQGPGGEVVPSEEW